MNEVVYQSLGHGITCIDAGYIQTGIACFYLLEEAGEYAVVETGTSHSFSALAQLMADRGITPEQVRYVIPTHVHLDHAGGAGTMMAAFPQAQLLIHPRGARHMENPARLIDSAMTVYGEDAFRRLYGEILPVDSQRIREVQDGEYIDLAGRALQIRHTRGHADHHFCVWDEASRGWFSGDMFGVSYSWFRFADDDFLLPTTTPTQFDPDAYYASLKLLGSYGPQRMYLTHYGELSYSQQKSQSLGQQVQAYAEFAVTHTDDPARLEQALTDYSVKLLRQLDADSSTAQHRDWLQFDMQLNAKGLQVWQRRAAAKPAP